MSRCLRLLLLLLLLLRSSRLSLVSLSRLLRLRCRLRMIRCVHLRLLRVLIHVRRLLAVAKARLRHERLTHTLRHRRIPAVPRCRGLLLLTLRGVPTKHRLQDTALLLLLLTQSWHIRL